MRIGLYVAVFVLLVGTPSPSPSSQKATDAAQQNAQPDKHVAKPSPAPIAEKNPAQNTANQNGTAVKSAENERAIRVVSLPPRSTGDTVALVCTTLLTLAGIVGIIVAICTVRSINEQVRLMQTSNEISRANLVSVQRAFVFMKNIEVGRAVINGIVEWRFSPRWQNSGTTPTKELRLHVNWWSQPTPLPKGYDFPDIGEHTDKPVVLGPNAETLSGPFHIPTTALVGVQQGTHHVYLWGRAVYRDVFANTPRHITKFCSKITGILGNLESMTETITFQFTSHDEYNCADEDCEENPRNPT